MSVPAEWWIAVVRIGALTKPGAEKFYYSARRIYPKVLDTGGWIVVYTSFCKNDGTGGILEGLKPNTRRYHHVPSILFYPT